MNPQNVNDSLISHISDRTGEPAEHLRKWQSLGLIRGDRASAVEDIERTRLIQLALRRGIRLEAIAKVESENGILGRYIRFIQAGSESKQYSLAEAAEVVGLDLGRLKRLRDATGVMDWGEPVDEEYLETLRHLRTGLEAGLPEEAILQLVRVYADSLTRVAEAEGRLFHFYVHERLKAAGVPAEELSRKTNASSDRLTPLIEPIILYFHRLALQRVIRENMVMHLAEEAGLAEAPEAPAQMWVAIAFVDLSSFTAMTSAMGDVAGAEVLDRFSGIVRESANRWEGRVVKQIGDAFMLVFPEPRLAVGCALEIEQRTASESQFSAVRSGIHWGPVLYRDGDYVGSNVNVAARLAAAAKRHEVLVTGAVSEGVKDGLQEGAELRSLGSKRLKGLPEEVELFEVLTPETATDKVLDPVCGMELEPAEVAARLTLESRELSFCADECLRRFVAAPERYLA